MLDLNELVFEQVDERTHPRSSAPLRAEAAAAINYDLIAVPRAVQGRRQKGPA